MKQISEHITLENLMILMLSVIVFLLPITQHYVPIIIAGWTLISIVNIIYYKLSFNKNWLLIIPTILYLLFLLGVSWSENKESAWFDMEVKMTLFIFPFIFLFIKLKDGQKTNIWRAFVLGSLVACIYAYIFAYGDYKTTEEINAFFYNRLSPFLHPTYLSMYLNLALIVIFIDIFTSKFMLVPNKWIYAPVILILVVTTFLLISKIGIIVCFLTCLAALIYWMIVKRTYLYGVLIIGIISYSLYYVYTISPMAQQRINEVMASFNAGKDHQNLSSTFVRFQIWDIGVDLIADKPIQGYGTGDVKDELVVKYDERGLLRASEYRLNAHNQFIQTGIAIGLLGLIPLLYMLFGSLYKGIRKKDVLIIGFILINILCFATESTLETQAGVLFFTISYSILASDYHPLKEDTDA